MTRAGSKTETGIRLLDLWSPSPNAGAPVGCIATTYTFDSTHFEEQCLGRFLRMESDPHESTRAYLIEREEKLAETFVCVLADQRHVEANRSLRWHLLGVRLPQLGIQHAKLSILLWERHLRVLIGSANLTEPGYRTNLETVVALEFAPQHGAPIALALECLRFLEGLAAFVPGSAEREGPLRELAAFRARARERIEHWGGSEGSTAVRCELIPLLPTRNSRSVLAQLKDIWVGPAPTYARVLSPFFDQNDEGLDRVYREFTGIMTSRGEREVRFASSGREYADGRFQVDLPQRLVESPLRHASMTHALGFVSDRQERDTSEAVRPLHSKLIILDRDQNSIVMIGSSNFTSAGFGLTKGHNAEFNVAYRIPPSEGKFYKQCEAALPPINWLDDKAPRELIAGFEHSEDTGSVLALLPLGFLEALYRPQIAGGTLELWLDSKDLPEQFAIEDPSGALVLDAKQWRVQFGSSDRVDIRVKAPASGLTVKWIDGAGESHSAIWVINVADVSKLIPPAELRNLSFEDLILVLTSTRPAFRVLAERAKAKASRKEFIEVDPHRRVDTSRFLLKRMRRLAKALEGLRFRLERPVSSLEGWRWRLHGPLGPVALARALRLESGGEGPFFVSEIAATLKELRLVAGDGIPVLALRQELDAAMSALRDLSFEQTEEIPENLAGYIRQIFPETVE